LIEGLVETNRILEESPYDPVLSAAVIAFGFVFIHPFQDGNGRIHRYLIHHVLAKKGFAPPGIVFPVSSVILDRIIEYRKTLEAYSKPRLDLIEWESTPKGNVEVMNDTMDIYRYFDATRQAEFLYECVQQTVEKTLPEEVAYLERHDRMKSFVGEHFEMPDKLVETLIAFLRQGAGKFSQRARTKEFSQLTEKEFAMLEEKFAEIFGAEQH
jgi:Fic family protein